MSESSNSCDEEIAVEAEIFLAEMKAIFGVWFDKYQETLRECKETRRGSVEIFFGDGQVVRLAIKKFAKHPKFNS